MSTDLIITWPQNCDYPLWRSWLRENYKRFQRVIVSFSPNDGPDYRAFLRETLEPYGVVCIDTEPTEEREWRDAAVNAALDLSTAEWVWFTEQDFEIVDPRFWTTVEALSLGARAVGIREDRRWHPCCLFVRRSIIEETPRYFGPDPVDHFYSFGLALGGGVVDLEKYTPGTWEHPAGTSRNMELIHLRRYREVRYPDLMATFLKRSLVSGCTPHPGWAADSLRFIDWEAESGV